MAESADALVSGTSGGDIVEVQVLSSAPFLCLLLFFDKLRSWRNWQTRYFEGVVFTRRMGSSPINRTIENLPSDCFVRWFFCVIIEKIYPGLKNLSKGVDNTIYFTYNILC